MKERDLKLPDDVDVDLACDGDLNTIWVNSEDFQYPSPKEVITVQAALLTSSRPIEDDDALPVSPN